MVSTCRTPCMHAGMSPAPTIPALCFALIFWHSRGVCNGAGTRPNTYSNNNKQQHAQHQQPQWHRPARRDPQHVKAVMKRRFLFEVQCDDHMPSL